MFMKVATLNKSYVKEIYGKYETKYGMQMIRNIELNSCIPNGHAYRKLQASQIGIS